MLNWMPVAGIASRRSLRLYLSLMDTGTAETVCFGSFVARL